MSDEQARQRHAGGDQTAGENHLHTARANCFHETEPGAGSDTGLKQNQADLPEGEVGAERDDPGEGARVFAVPQDQTHDHNDGLGRVPSLDVQARPAKACPPLGGRVHLDRHPQVVESSLRPFTGYRCKA